MIALMLLSLGGDSLPFWQLRRLGWRFPANCWARSANCLHAPAWILLLSWRPGF